MSRAQASPITIAGILVALLLLDLFFLGWFIIDERLVKMLEDYGMLAPPLPH